MQLIVMKEINRLTALIYIGPYKINIIFSQISFYFFPNSVKIFVNSVFSILIFGNPTFFTFYSYHTVTNSVFNVNDYNVHKLNRHYLKLIEVTNMFLQYCIV